MLSNIDSKKDIQSISNSIDDIRKEFNILNSRIIHLEESNKNLNTYIVKLEEFFNAYVDSHYKTTLQWLEKHGQEPVSEWAQWYFRDWDFDAHSTILKSKFLTKYNNIMPIR